MLRIAPLLLVICCCAFADVAKVESEPNLEKRSELALLEAGRQLETARKAYSAGNLDEWKRGVEQIGTLVDLSYKSLQDTGKKARKSPKWFKRAEQRLLLLGRQIDNMVKDTSLEDRPVVEAVAKRVHETHEHILNDIMSKK